MYWLTGLLGIAMAVAPWVLGFADNTSALWASFALGAILVVLSVVEAYQRGEAMWEYWTAGLVGVLAIIAPFVLAFSTLTPAFWSMVVLGGLVLLLSGIGVFTHWRVQS